MTLDELQAVIDAMTPGEWHDDGNGDVLHSRCVADGGVMYEAVAVSPQTRIDDARGIAALRNHAAALLAVARAVQEYRDSIEAWDALCVADSEPHSEQVVATHHRYVEARNAIFAALAALTEVRM